MTLVQGAPYSTDFLDTCSVISTSEACEPILSYKVIESANPIYVYFKYHIRRTHRLIVSFSNVVTWLTLV